MHSEILKERHGRNSLITLEKAISASPQGKYYVKSVDIAYYGTQEEAEKRYNALIAPKRRRTAQNKQTG